MKDLVGAVLMIGVAVILCAGLVVFWYEIVATRWTPLEPGTVYVGGVPEGDARWLWIGGAVGVIGIAFMLLGHAYREIATLERRLAALERR
jgi:hypothetical protein